MRRKKSTINDCLRLFPAVHALHCGPAERLRVSWVNHCWNVHILQHKVTNFSRSCAVSGIFQHQVTFTCHMWCLSRGLWTGLVGHVPSLFPSLLRFTMRALAELLELLLVFTETGDSNEKKECRRIWELCHSHRWAICFVKRKDRNLLNRLILSPYFHLGIFLDNRDHKEILKLGWTIDEWHFTLFKNFTWKKFQENNAQKRMRAPITLSNYTG